MPVPALCPARLEDCARLTAEAVNLAERLRTPVILLTEREPVSTQRTVTLDEAGLALLETPPPAARPRFEGAPGDFRPYGNLDAHQVPAFLEAGNPRTQTRFTASTHGEQAFILKATPEAVRNTTRLADKIRANVSLFPAPRLDRQEGADTLIVSYGCTDYAAREAVLMLRARGIAVSHLTLLTLYPVQGEAIAESARGVRRVIIPEENLTGLYRRQLLGERLFEGSAVVGVNRVGQMVTPEQIVAEAMR
jgi:2-oxoglutarate ferredoxin oxidoreductase subunit alpha